MESLPPLRAEPAMQPDPSLRGGLKGRLASDFCVVQGMVDALTRYLEKEAPEPVRTTGLEALMEVERRLRRLYRLSDNAADLALGSALRTLRAPQPVELIACLAEICDCSNEELAACGAPLRLELETGATREPVWVEADTALIDGIAANLMSNALLAGAGHIQWSCTADRRLQYRDDGPGLPASARDLLCGRIPEGGVPALGGTGLLLVREYAAVLGWGLDVGQGAGTSLAFSLPPYAPDPSHLLLADDSQVRLSRQNALRQRLRRELSVLG